MRAAEGHRVWNQVDVENKLFLTCTFTINNEIMALANEKIKKKRKSVSSADSFELFSFFISSLFPQDFCGNID